MSDKFRICFGTMAAFLLGADLVLCAGMALLENPWTALGIGAALLIAAGVLAFVFRRSEELWQTVLTIALAAAGCGLGMAACLIPLEFSLSGPFALRLLAAFGGVLVLYLAYGLIAERMERGLKWFTFALIGLLWTAAVLLWIFGGRPELWGLVFFQLFLGLLFVFPLIIRAEEITTLRRNLALSSLTIAFLVLLIALVILTEGEALEGGELIEGFSVESPGKSRLNRRKALPPG